MLELSSLAKALLAWAPIEQAVLLGVTIPYCLAHCIDPRSAATIPGLGGRLQARAQS